MKAKLIVIAILCALALVAQTWTTGTNSYSLGLSLSDDSKVSIRDGRREIVLTTKQIIDHLENYFPVTVHPPHKPSSPSTVSPLGCACYDSGSGKFTECACPGVGGDIGGGGGTVLEWTAPNSNLVLTK